jgi:glycosyltransferase involved in cell wall biosynthesis
MPQQTQKILYVINHIDWFWSHRLPLAKGAQGAGYDVHVAVTGAAADSKLAQQNFTGHGLPASEGGPLNLLRAIWALHKIMAQQKPNVVHAITLKYAFITGLAALLHPSIRVVHTIAGLGYLFSGEGLKPRILRALVGPFLKLALSSARTSLIFQNPDDMRLMIARGFARPERCHLILGSGVDLNEFKPIPAQPSDCPVVLMPTRLVRDKGIAVFIEAAKLLRQNPPRARFQIAGGISQSNPLAITETEMKAMLDGSTVEWLGKVSDMPGLLGQAAIIAYPSYYGEGIPKVLLEAAAMGKAIVTTDHPGCREVVADGENGLLVPVKDARALAAGIQALLENTPRREDMGRESRRRAETMFDVALIVRQTLAVYESSKI